MTTAPAIVIDQLNELLQAEISSIIHFMGEGSPYLDRADADLRTMLREMVAKIDVRAAAIADLIDWMGGIVRDRSDVNRDDQYLAFLSFKFLLPKLVEAKQLLIERYQNALGAIEQAADGEEARVMLTAFREEHVGELKMLRDAEKRNGK
jgi:hypothetical protein